MKIKRMIDGNLYEFELTDSELVFAYCESKDKYDREDFFSRLERDGSWQDFYNAIPDCDKNDFIIDVLEDYRDAEAYNDDWQRSMDDSIEWVIDSRKKEMKQNA